MTFLLQKFNAINRTRTPVRARNGLRSSAGSIAFTGRFAACLLLAGFLGVGSAMAQPKVLRSGGGDLDVSFASGQQVHHYLIDTDGDGDYSDEKLTAAGTNPTGQGGTVVNTFLVGGLALVTVNTTDNQLEVSPIPNATGGFKIAMAADATAEISDTNVGTPTEFVLLSRFAPMLKGIKGDYNQGADSDMEALTLTQRDAESKEYNLLEWFDDPNDVFLTYEAKVDLLMKGGTSTAGASRAKVDKDGDAIVSATISGNKLTVARVNMKAMEHDQTDIWVFARDGSEYARKRIAVTIGEPANPYVKTAESDKVLRENAADDTTIDLAAIFADPMLVAAADAVTNMDASALTYSVKISGSNVPKVGDDNDFTWVIPAMTARVQLTDVVATEGGVGHTGAMLTIRPRAPGAATFTVTATDRGLRCATTEVYVPPVEADATADPPVKAAAGFCYTHEADGSRSSEDRDGFGADPTLTGAADTRTDDQKAADAKEVASRKALYHGAKSITDVFTVTVVTKTTPVQHDKNSVTNLTDTSKSTKTTSDDALVADSGESVTINLEDLNGDEKDAPALFVDPTGDGLTYAATAKQDGKKMDVVDISIDGSMLTLTPIWRSGTVTVDVSVTATNTLDETSVPSTFKVTVKTATLPVVNQLPAIQGILAQGFSLNTGGEPLVLQLMNLNNAKEAKDAIPLFIDPNAASGDALPGGLLLKMQIKDVVADHRYDHLSKENDVYTSAMRITLNPAAPNPTLTIRPLGANSAMVTVWAIDRERHMVSATATVTVVSGVSAEDAELPTEVELSQNYPNPFNPQTTIDYALPQAGDVSLVVYDMLGREVDVLLDGPQAAGRHTVRFGGDDLSSGSFVWPTSYGE